MKRIATCVLSGFLLLAASPALADDDATTVFQVSGMTCGMCAKAIERALEDVPGVRTVEIDRDSGQVAVTADADVAAGTLEGAIEAAGELRGRARATAGLARAVGPS